jgi:hypothetical protein
MTSHYKAYLLRLQRGEAQVHWRVTLVDALSGERKSFATERDLLIHLMQTLAIEAPSTKGSEDDIHGEA